MQISKTRFYLLLQLRSNFHPKLSCPVELRFRNQGLTNLYLPESMTEDKRVVALPEDTFSVGKERAQVRNHHNQATSSSEISQIFLTLHDQCIGVSAALTSIPST